METPDQSGIGPGSGVVYLRIYKRDETAEENELAEAAGQPETAGQQPPKSPTDEDYWAGRNHAMRKSARIAA